MRRTVSSFVLLLTASLFTLTSCIPSYDFTLLSNFNFEVGEKYVSQGVYVGKSTKKEILGFRITETEPHVEYAYENAVDQGDGVIMTDVNVTIEFGGFLFFYSEASWVVEGEVWALADRLSEAELEGKETFELLGGESGFQLVNTENPDDRRSIFVKSNLDETEISGLEDLKTAH